MEETEKINRKHSSKRPYRCPKCPKEFDSKTDLNRHLDTHKPLEERERMECHVCGKSFLSKIGLTLHIKSHDGDVKCGIRTTEERVLRKTCNICNKTFYNKAYLRHEKTVHGEKLHECHKCGKMFSRKDVLSKHLKTHALQRKRFQCEKCPKNFLTKANYDEHRLIHQGLEYSFQCDKCEHRFLTFGQLKSHKGNSHLAKSGILSCAFCERQCPNHSKLHLHLAHHIHERSYFCKHCPAEFITLSCLNSHKRTHIKSREKLKCEMCSKSFLSKYGFNNHIRRHTGELHFECKSPGCGIKFATYDRRRDHFLKAHVGKLFACTICEKKFLTKFYLKRHALIHSDVRGYQCKFCEAAFKQPESLRHHERKVHLFNCAQKLETA